MQGFVKNFSRVTIRQQLYRIYTVVVAVPILLIGSFLLAYTNHMLRNYYTDLLESDNYRVRNILFDITREVYGISRDISFDSGVRGILAEDFETRQEYMRAVEQTGVFWRAISWESGYRDNNWDLCLVRQIPLVNSPYHAVMVIHVESNYLRMWVDSTEYSTVMSVDRGAVFYSSDMSNVAKIHTDFQRLRAMRRPCTEKCTPIEKSDIIVCF